MEKPFKVAYVVRTKNGDLYQAIKDRGWTLIRAAKYLGITSATLGKMINLKARPPQYRKQPARFKHFCERVMKLTGKTFEEIFPDEVYSDEVMARAKPIDFFIEKDLATLKLNPSSDASLVALPEYTDSTIHYEEALSIIRRILSNRQWLVIEARYLRGLTCAEASIELGFDKCNQRVSQIEREALQRIREHKHILSILRGDEDIELNRAIGSGRVISLSKRSGFAVQIA